MNDMAVSALSMDERALAAAKDQTALEELITEYRPFLHSCAAKYATGDARRYHEEYFSVAMLGFYEAIEKYEAEKGHFFSFASNVINRRLIDEIRRHYRQNSNVIYLEDIAPQDTEAQSAAVAAASRAAYEANEARAELLEEIEQFKADLAQWQITLKTLAQQSPKHKALRAQCATAIRHAAEAPDIMQTFHLK